MTETAKMYGGSLYDLAAEEGLETKFVSGSNTAIEKSGEFRIVGNTVIEKGAIFAVRNSTVMK